MPPETVPCPGCAAPLEPAQEVCGACRRPRDEREIQAGYDLLRSRGESRRRRPLKLLLWLALAGAAAGAYVERGTILKAFQGARDQAAQAYADAADPARLAGRAPGTPPQTATGKAVVAFLNARGVQGPGSGTPGPGGAVRAARAPQPPEPRKWERCVYGVVSDLSTGLAVAGAAVRVRSGASPSALETKTDGFGRYAVSIDESFLKAGEATLEVSAPGYALAAEDDETPSFEKPDAVRPALIARLRERERTPMRVNFAPSAVYEILNVVLVPDGAAAAPAAAASAPTSAPPPAPRAVRPPEPPPPDKLMRRAYGVVFDMATAAAIPNAQLTFRLPQSEVLTARADRQGRYQIDLTRRQLDEGITVEVEASGYRPGQIEDGRPSFLDRSDAQRLTALRETTPRDFEPIPLRYADMDDFIPLDLALVPEEKKP